MTFWVSADSHVGHQRIIELCHRPYANVDDMNGDLLVKWNAIVSPLDTVWFLGDFCWQGSEHFFYQLNGEKHLIIGNHDGKATLALPWASQQMYRELTVVEESIKTKLVLFHYPIESWSGFHKGHIHLHGHTHGNLPDKPTRCDVGVDRWSMQPVTLPQIKARLATIAG